MYKYQRFWDRIANNYAKTPIKDRQAYNALLNDISKHLKREDVVLDFGCGTGTYSIAIADKVKSVHATDISEKMLSIANKRAEDKNINNIQFKHLTIFDKKFKPESYNVVLTFNILHLQNDLNSVLHRINELLVPGGLLISKTVCIGEKFSFLRYFIKPFSKLGLLPHINSFTFDKLKNSINQQHLEILETHNDIKGSMEYFVVAKKP